MDLERGIGLVDVCVLGLGRIGLPLALLLAKAGHRVVGVDVNPLTLRKIGENKLDWANADAEKELLREFLGKNLSLTPDLGKALSSSEVVFIAIGTGVGPDGAPELTSLFGLVDKMCAVPSVMKGKLVVLKSTLPVGTTRRVASIIEEKTCFSCGKDFFVVFCPERVLGDKALSEMVSLPKVIGGMDKASSEKAAHVYATIGGKLIIVDNPESAEFVKLLDNSYRQTIFAFANDFALLAERYKINAYEIIKVANDNYPRNNIPLPSGGVGGYCLTKDPLYLEASFKEIAEKRGFSSVWFMARKTNDYMPVHMVDLLKEKLAVAGKSLKGSTILICGVAYKENTDDIRNSHGLQIARMLRTEGAEVLLWDPNVRESISGFQMVKDVSDVLGLLDALVFTVRHREFVRLNQDNGIMSLVAKMRTPVVVDGWGMFQGLIGRKDVYYTSVGIKG